MVKPLWLNDQTNLDIRQWCLGISNGELGFAWQNFHFVRCNIITIGECGKFPPSTYCHISTLCYINRLFHMSDEEIAKKIYNDLISLNQGFKTWATVVMEVLGDLKSYITMNMKSFALNCKRAVQNKFVAVWNTSLQVSHTNPILRTYKVFKSDFTIEPYLCLVNKPGYRQAMAKLRCSSHILEIERGRHTNPKPPLLRDCVVFVMKLKMRSTSYYIAVLMRVKGEVSI